ncbi:MAG: hypothetical protein RR475_02210 [Clostridia bacterium]
MRWYEILALFLGPIVLVELVRLVSDRLKRKDVVTDKKDDTANQIEELRTETSEQFRQVNERMSGFETNLNSMSTTVVAVATFSKAQAYDRIRHLCLQYIKKNKITDKELENLMEMHRGYKKLGGDGFLDRLMYEVNNNIRIVPDDEED